MAYLVHGRALVPTPEGCVHGFKRGAQKGLVFAYIPIAAKKLGRNLLKEEVVHHIDKNPDNNNPDNLIVFASRVDHLLFHSYGCNMDLVKLNANGAYYLPEENKPKKPCSICGKPVANRFRKYCDDCVQKRKASTVFSVNGHSITRTLLQTQVWKMSISKLAEHYGVSDNAIHKWCIKLNIEKPPRGYWNSHEQTESIVE